MLIDIVQYIDNIKCNNWSWYAVENYIVFRIDFYVSFITNLMFFSAL